MQPRTLLETAITFGRPKRSLRRGISSLLIQIIEGLKLSLYDIDFHQTDISGLSFLITGGAGFIGSNIVEYLVHHGAGKIRILDNLSEGKLENIQPFLTLENVELRIYSFSKILIGNW